MKLADILKLGKQGKKTKKKKKGGKAAGDEKLTPATGGDWNQIFGTGSSRISKPGPRMSDTDKDNEW